MVVLATLITGLPVPGRPKKPAPGLHPRLRLEAALRRGNQLFAGGLRMPEEGLEPPTRGL